MRKSIVLATLNQHKVEELTAMLGRDLGQWSFESASQFVGKQRWHETGLTFIENARIKAEFVAQLCPGRLVLADDSGLEIEALGGRPGVNSSCFAGVEGDHTANNAKLLLEMRGASNRRARFVCHLFLLSPDGSAKVFVGDCKGTILEDYRGRQGFGYDPLFVPDGYNTTFAEMSEGEKNQSVIATGHLLSCGLFW